MTSLNITNLDFEGIKTDLKRYLQGQDTFNSYNFEGSGLSVLLNVLAQVATTDAYLANMIYNEAFLDSAIKRASVVSKAKELGYTPRSISAAKATVNIAVNSPTTSPLPSSFTIPAYQSFTSVINGVNLNFTNINPISIPNTINGFVANNVSLAQGNIYNIKYTVATGTPAEKFLIPNNNVDTATLRVVVQNSLIDTTSKVYTKASDIQNLTTTSQVYFVEEGINGQNYISFGDGTIGASLVPGNIVSITYLITSGKAGNAPSSTVQSFKLNGTVQGETNISITTVANSFGGDDAETIDSIKFLAPKYYVSQDRAITQNDYITLISQNISGIQAIAVWGGETMTPPQYGKVYISLEVAGASTIPQGVKDEISALLSTRKGLTVIVEFTEPNYLYVSILSKIQYDKTMTSLSAVQITANITTSIQNYFNNNLSKFASDFHDTMLTDNIVTENSYVTSVSNSVRMSQRIVPIPNISGSFIIRTSAAIEPGTLSSSYFYYSVNGAPVTAVLSDDGNGNIMANQASTNAVIASSVGSVDYANGIVNLNNFQIAGFIAGNTDVRVYVNMNYQLRDIKAQENMIIKLDDLLANPSANIKPAISIAGL
jgi:hypothetical protein